MFWITVAQAQAIISPVSNIHIASFLLFWCQSRWPLRLSFSMVAYDCKKQSGPHILFLGKSFVRLIKYFILYCQCYMMQHQYFFYVYPAKRKHILVSHATIVNKDRLKLLKKELDPLNVNFILFIWINHATCTMDTFIYFRITLIHRAWGKKRKESLARNFGLLVYILLLYFRLYRFFLLFHVQYPGDGCFNGHFGRFFIIKIMA